MTSEVHKLLQEFSIKMNDRPELPEDEEDEEFDFDLDKSPNEFDEFGDDEFGDDEFGSESEFPSGLDDIDDDGEFAGERKVDITDRLKKMLARRGEDGLNFDDSEESPSLDLSDIDDLSSERNPRRMRGYDDIDDMNFDDMEDSFEDRPTERPRMSNRDDRLGRFRGDRGRRGDVPTPERRSLRDR